MARHTDCLAMKLRLLVKVGDLVKIQKWCKNKGELAVVTRVPPWKGEVYIEYLNPAAKVRKEAGYVQNMARTGNLILVSEA